jgi:hypothetical protein
MPAPEDSITPQDKKASSTTSIPIIVIKGDNNTVEQSFSAADANASIEEKWYESLKNGVIYVITHPEWALKWAATFLLLQLFFMNGFSVRTYRDFINPPTGGPSSS